MNLFGKKKSSTPGWDAIDKACKSIYGAQEPIHFGTKQPYQLGGPDPLDGISVYRSEVGEPHWHYVSYGMSDLYAKESSDRKLSGFGIEFTIRVNRFADEQTPPTWPLLLLQNLARYVFDTRKVFSAGHRMNGNAPIANDQPTQLTAVAFLQDPELGEISTPHGTIHFVQLVGINANELEVMQLWTTAGVLEVMAQSNPLLITNLSRASILLDPEKVEIIRQGIENE